MTGRVGFGAMMIAGSASGVGKSTITAGLCRSLFRRGHSVSPYKAQNMSNHAAVTADGGEIGRAQANQAQAAGVEPTVHMNPLLLKPTSDMASHVVVQGREVGVMDGFNPGADDRRDIVLDSYRQLTASFDRVVLEGAGGAAEINLLDRDLVNLPFAAAAGVPAIVVVDIDRGGAFASAFGTIELLPPDLRATVAGVILNRFRGDVSLLGDGITDLERRTKVPVLGVLPHLGPEPLLGSEDSLDISLGLPALVNSNEPSVPSLRASAIALPHLSNPSDLDPLVGEHDVALTWTRRPGDVMASDLVIVPGSRATVRDLHWLYETGLGAALRETKARVVGICGGYQMLGQTIIDDVESCSGTTNGLGLLPISTEFMPDKVVAQRTGVAQTGATSSPVTGYEIRFGQPRRLEATSEDWFLSLDAPEQGQGSPAENEGVVGKDRRVWGTSLHGLFDADDFRRAFLADTAAACRRQFSPSKVGYQERLQAQHDRLADWVDAHLTIDQLEAIAKTASGPDEMPGW